MQGFSREDVANGIGVKYTTFCDWAKGRTYPKMEYIKEIADFVTLTNNEAGVAYAVEKLIFGE